MGASTSLRVCPVCPARGMGGGGAGTKRALDGGGTGGGGAPVKRVRLKLKAGRAIAEGRGEGRDDGAHDAGLEDSDCEPEEPPAQAAPEAGAPAAARALPGGAPVARAGEGGAPARPKLTLKLKTAGAGDAKAAFREAMRAKKEKEEKEAEERARRVRHAAAKARIGGLGVEEAPLGDADVEAEDGHLDECEEMISDGEDEDALLGFQNFSGLSLKPDHANRPLWVCSDGRVFLETFSAVYRQAYDFMIAVAEPVCRPEAMHEYKLTPHSLYAAVSVGLETHTIITVLNRLSKNELPAEVVDFIRESTENYGKVKLVLKQNKFFVESEDPEVLRKLLEDDVIRGARVMPLEELDRAQEVTPTARASAQADGALAASLTGDAAVAFGDAEGGFLTTAAPAQLPLREAAAGLITDEQQAEIEAEAAAKAAAGAAGGKAGPGVGGTGAQDAAVPPAVPVVQPSQPAEMHSFEIEASEVEHVKARCLPSALNYPMMEEYDFQNDTVNKDLNMDLKPMAQLRPYQEKSLAKMFGNGRARSGIIVLPCGAGKSLTGVAAACRVRKSILVLCTSSVSVDQWRMQFKLWSTIQDRNISRFISESKEMWTGDAGVTVTTYNMVAFSGRRSEEAQKVMEAITSREWGLMVLDEVHVVPAHMFRKVIGITKAHCKLGLTATLVREDELIADLNFLIGPKLYEANWLDLQENGYIARVQCVEVWCEMTPRFYRAYMSKEYSQLQQALYVMNPNKYAAAEFLVRYHEQQCGDKVIVFSDNVYALKEYAIAMRKPYIYGPTPLHERNRILYAFKHSNEVNTIFLSKVGDNSIDIPEANVIIQISSHAGSRRQEAQRLGRILRAKANTRKDEYNAFFYSLVSKDTAEMVYSARRQQFLIDQGYAFKVITDLGEASSGAVAGSQMETDVLKKLLAARADETGIETIPHGADDLVEQGGRALAAATAKPAPKARRAVGNMAALSGGAGMRYMEYGTGGDKGKEKERKRHALFKKRGRM